MKMGIKMLKLINKEEKSSLYLDIIEDECEKEINLVNNLLTLEQIQANQLTIEPKKHDLKPLIDNLYQEFSQSLDYQKIRLEIDYQLDYIYTDENSISLIIKELIKNASKFSAKETEINLQIYKEAKHNIIKIENYGLMIEQDELELIFQPFYQGKQVENVTNSGTGLGLALVKSLVENLNGTINVSSIPCQDSQNYLNTFTLKFPQLPNLIDET
jgi:signal transduction histidine kinase